LLIAGNAVFVAAETGLVTIDRNEVESRERQGDVRFVRVAGTLRRLSTYLSGAQLGITVTSLAIGLVAEPSLATLLEGPLPVRIVRAAQFHEFVDQLVGWMIQDDVAYVPEMRTQLVAARVVAEALADAAEEPEIENGRITEIAGPQEERLAAAAAMLFASRGDTIEIREVPPSGDPDTDAYAQGAALPNPGATLAGPSFEAWLATARRPSTMGA